MSLQMTARGGFMRELSPEKPIPINSLFTMGGPYSLRGFEFGGVGPQIEGHSPGTHVKIFEENPFFSYFKKNIFLDVLGNWSSSLGTTALQQLLLQIRPILPDAFILQLRQCGL